MPATREMIAAFLVLFFAYPSVVFGLKGTAVELSDGDRKELLDGLNKLRGSLGSSNMECLSSWSSEMEAEAQRMADKCEIVESNDKYGYGIGMVYTSERFTSMSKYVELVGEGRSTFDISGHCPCKAGNEHQCNAFKQFTYWEGGKVGCAISQCLAPPDKRTMVMACLFEKKFTSNKCPYAEGTACSFCSSGLTCVSGLCCKSAEPVGGASCGSKPADKLLVSQLAKDGYTFRGTIGYVVEEVGFCSSTVSVYNFGVRECSNFYLTDEEKAENWVYMNRKSAPDYKGKPFAVWKE